MAAKPKSTIPPGHVAVRLTIRPDEDHITTEEEVPILRQQGLLVENTTAATGDPGAGEEAS